jgi:hypothetical protein
VLKNLHEMVRLGDGRDTEHMTKQILLWLSKILPKRAGTCRTQQKLGNALSSGGVAGYHDA